MKIHFAVVSNKFQKNDWAQSLPNFTFDTKNFFCKYFSKIIDENSVIIALKFVLSPIIKKYIFKLKYMTYFDNWSVDFKF